jgi:hypothetical protein
MNMIASITVEDKLPASRAINLPFRKLNSFSCEQKSGTVPVRHVYVSVMNMITPDEIGPQAECEL